MRAGFCTDLHAKIGNASREPSAQLTPARARPTTDSSQASSEAIFGVGLYLFLMNLEYSQKGSQE